jgi:predicted outer membrane protein
MRKLIAWVVVPALFAAAAVSAQERLESARERDPGFARAAGGGQTARADQEIAAVKLAYCRNEIELAKLAAQKSKSNEVRQFATQLVKDGTAGCAKLEQRAANLGNAVSAGADVRVQPGGRTAVDVAVGGGARDALNWVAINQQMANECLRISKEELGKKDGDEFDKCFIGMTLAGQHQTIVADRVFLNYASSEFRGDLEECAKTANARLEEAKQIMEKLAGNSKRAGASQ